MLSGGFFYASFFTLPSHRVDQQIETLGFKLYGSGEWSVYSWKDVPTENRGDEDI